MRARWRLSASPATLPRMDSAFVFTGLAVSCGTRYGNTTLHKPFSTSVANP